MRNTTCKRLLSLLIALLLLSGCHTTDTTQGRVYSDVEDTPFSINIKPDAVVLTLATLVPDIQVQYAVSEFNHQNDEYQIQIVTYNDEYSMDLSASIEAMNLAIISGETPDILFLDSLDVKSFENKGLLLDLTDFMEKDASFSTDDYFMNIWDLFNYRGGIYELVPCFWLEGIIGPSALLGSGTGWTIEDYYKLQQENGTLLSATSELMSVYMARFALDPFVNIEDGSCDFESDEFMQWLEFVHSFPLDSKEDGLLQCGTISGVADYAAYHTQFSDAQMIGYPSATKGSACAVSMQSYGICSTTKYPEICWEFCKLLISDEVQRDCFSGYGIPMNKAVFEEQLAASMLPTENEKSLFYGQEDISPLSQEAADKLLSLIDSIDHSAFRYLDIQNILNEEIGSYLVDDKSASEVAKLIQSRVRIYLSEQQ